MINQEFSEAEPSVQGSLAPSRGPVRAVMAAPGERPGHQLMVGVISDDQLRLRGIASVLQSLPEVTKTLELSEPDPDMDLHVVDNVAWLRMASPGKVIVVCDPDYPLSRILQPPFPNSYITVDDFTPPTLSQAIKDSFGGRFAVPIDLLHRRKVHENTSAEHRHQELTQRETDTLTLAASGLSNVQIAKDLRISQHSVKRLLASTMVKLGADNRTGAVVEAIRRGTLPCPHEDCSTCS